MDQKKMSDLDPKLKEAYDRVMGFATPQTAKTQPTEKPHEVRAQPAPATQQEPKEAPQPATSTNYQVATIQAATTGQQTPAAAAEKPGSKVVPLVFIAGGIILLVLYGLFWIRFWNVQIF